jgi:excinuclease ABC subunit B
VAILDADKEGFLRNEKSLVQTVGRAARNVNGMVIMYADRMTVSMEKTISETTRRRKMQEAYNLAHGMVPTPLNKAVDRIIEIADNGTQEADKGYNWGDQNQNAAEDAPQYFNPAEMDKRIKLLRKSMEKAAKDLDFIEAARLRDELMVLEKRRKNSK